MDKLDCAHIPPVTPHGAETAPPAESSDGLLAAPACPMSKLALTGKLEAQAELASLRRSDAALPDLSGGLGDYMLKRSIIGRKLDERQTERLIQGNQTVQETRALLDRGRGNVTSDIEKTLGQSTWYTEAGRAMEEKLF